MFSAASFLVIHGSRDPRPGQDFAQLLTQLQSSMPHHLIAGGTLEGQDTSLADQVMAFSHLAQQHQYTAVQVLPLFLLPGVHVQEDIPSQLSLAQAHSPLPLNLLPFWGQYPGLVQVLRAYPMTPTSSDHRSWIILAHGSRRPEALAWIDHLARQLNALPAYWMQPQTLNQAISTLISQGHNQITIFPYLLFAGKLLEAITTYVNALQQDYPQARLILTDCLRPQPALIHPILGALAINTFAPARSF